MEVTRIQPQKPPLQQLFRVTFASVVFLLVVSIWAIVNYCEDESANMLQLTTVMQPTYTYFDTNRGLAPISQVVLKSDGNNADAVNTLPTCPTGYTLSTVYKWNGNNAGYVNAQGVYAVGTAPTAAGVTAVQAHTSATASLFNNVGLCVKTMPLTTFKLRSSATAACAANQIGCSTCYCSTTVGTTGGNTATPVYGTQTAATWDLTCPITTISLGDATAAGTAPTGVNMGSMCSNTQDSGTPYVPYAQTTAGVANKWAYSQCTWGYQTGQSWLVGFNVELFQTPCMDPNQHGQATAGGWTTLLKDSYTGCGTLGTDPLQTQLWGTIESTYYLDDFLKDNSQNLNANSMGSTLNSAWASATTQQVTLWAQHRIEMGCSPTCQAQNLGNIMTVLNTQMQAAYGDLKVIIYITAIGGGLCMLWCAYLVWRRSEATQSEYLQFWGATLLVLVVTCILLALFVSNVSSTYNANRANLPVLASCITNTSWQKLPNQIYALSSMDSEANWAITWLTFGVILCLAMGYIMMRVSQALDRLNRPQDMPMY